MSDDLPDEALNATLRQIELDSRHPTRKLAARLIEACRERAGEFQSDADREGLPRVNRVHSGAPLLDVDAAIARSLPNQARRK